MQLPKAQKNKKALKHKICFYADPITGEKCDREFIGVSTAKYCDVHRNPRNRKRPRRVVIKDCGENSPNVRINHKHQKTTEMIMRCALNGCDKEFSVFAIPGVYVFPRYCDKHRTPFQRENHLRIMRIKQ